MENSKTFLEETVTNLKEEVKLLNCKIQNARGLENIGTYKNLVTALGEILRLIERYDWRKEYSNYSLEDGTKQVATWEQNNDGQIRNHKIWNVADKAYTMKLHIDTDKLRRDIINIENNPNMKTSLDNGILTLHTSEGLKILNLVDYIGLE